MIKGSHHSEESKKKLSGSCMGRPAPNKGKPFSKESREKMSVAKKGKKMSPEFKEKRKQIMREQWADPKFREEMSLKKRGESNYNFGKPMSDEQKEKLSIISSNRSEEWRGKLAEAKLGKKDSVETKLKKSLTHKGEKCYNWKGGITPVYKAIRGKREYKEWCQEVLKRHNFIDVFTKTKSKRLSCHHIIPVNFLIKWYSIKTIDQALECKLIWDPENGIAMDKVAHENFHNKYGDSKVIFELSKERIAELYQ